MISCAQCKFEIRDDALGRLPPWCPGCGCDLKVARGEAPATPSAQAPLPDTSSAQPAATAGDSLDTWIGHPRQESLQETITRVMVSQQGAQQEERRGRRNGLQVFGVGLFLLASGVGIAWLSDWLSDGRQMVIGSGILILGGFCTLAGLYGMLTGRNVIKVDEDRGQPPC